MKSTPNNELVIRLLNAEHSSVLLGLRNSANLDVTLGSIAERLRTQTPEQIAIELCPPYQTVGAFIGENLLGSASLSRMLRSPFDSDATQWFAISGVIVHPTFRKKGIGNKLLQYCLFQAREQHAKGLLLEVNVPNPSAKKLYESFGFENWNTHENAYIHDGQKFDRISMRLRLDAGAV